MPDTPKAIIFLPFKKDLNPYLDEIQIFSKLTFVYDNFKNYSPTYNIVNIHWPEALFDWLEPTEEQLKDLAKAIIHWKEKSCIVYTKHDASRHKGMTPAFTKLFELIEKNTDVFIHLGEFSKNLYEIRFPDAQHKIVCHPLYLQSYPQFDKMTSRLKLGIDKDALVVIAPGQIRNLNERKLVLKAFRKLDLKNKVLIVSRMKNEIKYDFRGRIKLKKIFDYRNFLLQRFDKKYQAPQYLFTYAKLNALDLGLRMAAADVVLIPRQKILNSGTLFLGLTYEKIIVGPEVGNITEQLKVLGFPLFNPFSRDSVFKALRDGISLFRSNYTFKKDYIANFHPEKIAEEMDVIFNDSIIKK